MTQDGFAVVELPVPVAACLGLPSKALPVAVSLATQTVYQDRLQLPFALHGLAAYLDVFPGQAQVHAEAVQRLALLAGDEAGARGDLASAADLYAIGLACAPRNQTLRMRRGLALHSMGRPGDALVEYKTLMESHGTKANSLLEKLVERARQDIRQATPR
jgi:hypothetical protein